MSILVLGAAGYVGSVLCKKLLERHYKVIAVDKGFFGFEGLKELEDNENFKIVKKDGFDLLGEDLVDCSCFINLSGLSNDPMADFNPELNFKLNTDLTEFTAKLCKTYAVEKYIFGSTASIYDFGTSNENQDIVMNESAIVNPVKFYSLSKYKAEQKLLALADNNFKPIILRKATICGYSPRMRYDLVVNTFVKDALKNKKIRLNGGGENWRPLIDINDICDIYCLCIDLDTPGIYNAVGYNIRVSELALRTFSLLKQLGHNISIECDYQFPKTEIRNYRVDGSKLRKSINYQANTNIEKTIGGLVDNICNNSNFDNPIYYNIAWTKQYLQHWLKY
mgnify:CR=1 FL=1